MLKKLLLLTSCMLLMSCASTAIKSTRIDNNIGLSDGHGVVAVQLVNNTEKLSQYHRDWTEVIVVRLDNRKQLQEQAIAAAKAKADTEKKKFDPEKVDWNPDVYTLSPSTEGVVSSQLFVGSMPAGEYMISSLYAYYSDGNMSSWVQMPVRGAAGVFTVNAGQLSSLGTLVFQPLLNVKSESFWRNSSSQKAFVTRIGEQNLTDYVLAKYPNLKTSLDVSEVQGWQDDKFQSLRQQLAEKAQENAWGNTSFPLFHQGQGVLMARFGLLHLQDNQGKWQKIKLPTNTQLTSVLDTPDFIAVGAERGQLFVAKIPTEQWQHYQPVSPEEAIVWIRRGSDQYYAMTQSSGAFTLYQTAELLSGWQRIGTFKRKEFSFLVQYGGVFAYLDQQGKLKVLNDSELHHYDSDTKQWRKQKAQAMVKLSQQRDGTLLGLAVSQWDGIGDQQVSYDYGSNWQPIRRSLRLFGDRAAESGLAAKLDNDVLVTLSRERRDQQKGSQFYLMTSDSKKLNMKDSWQLQGAVQDECSTLLPELTFKQTLYLLCTEGDVISTSDLGQTWQTVVDVDIPALQQSFEQLLNAMMQQGKAASE